ncbi:hypothetical protein FACS189418_9270 [Clostridia bacterium]|nr:hypothetical protein FACS189418_9270 [Clostridia bacterium]
MLDIKLLRSNFEEIKKALSARNEQFDLDQFQVLDEDRRKKLAEVEELKNRLNLSSKEVAKRKKAGEDISDLYPIALSPGTISSMVSTNKKG